MVVDLRGGRGFERRKMMVEVENFDYRGGSCGRSWEWMMAVRGRCQPWLTGDGDGVRCDDGGDEDDGGGCGGEILRRR